MAKKKSANDTEAIGLHNAISKQNRDIAAKTDNSLWWTLGLLLFAGVIIAIWFKTTF